MPRSLWKGAISFGLVHIPVALYTASHETGIDFDWLDKRTMDPVGYKRINKRTGEEIDADDIVKGIKQVDGDYVVLSEDEIKAAYPKATQTIEIEAFVQASEISFMVLEKPYYTAPIGKGQKVYALLREAMLEAGVIGIARVVMHSKEHLAALVPDGAALVLDTIRWASAIRPRDEIDLPAAGRRAAGLKESELKMAHQLIADMTTAWQPDDYADRFTGAIEALAAKRVEAGKTKQVTAMEEARAPDRKSNVVDLTELLKRSLGKRLERDAAESEAGAKKAAHWKTATKTAGSKKNKATRAAKKTPRKKAA